MNGWIEATSSSSGPVAIDGEETGRDAPAEPRPLDGVVGSLAALGDGIRMRILLLLARSDLNVGELSQALQTPQSTVSRHLRTLSEAGWVDARSDGPRRVYRLREGGGVFDTPVWRGVRSAAGTGVEARADAERLRAVLAEREIRSRDFFRGAAGEWERIRGELFGSRTDLQALTALLDPGWRVADLGCGTGDFTALVAPHVTSVMAVDREPGMVEGTRRRTNHLSNVKVAEGELTTLPLEDGSVDAAFCLLVLHLVPEPREALREAARILREGGVFVAVDMRRHDREEYRDTMGHLWAGFTPEQLEGWMGDAGFREVVVRPLDPEAGAKGPLLLSVRGRKG